MAEQPARQREYREVDGVIYCDRRGCPGSTGLRCYRTGVPICQKCAIRTPVGYLSKDAAREQQNLYFNITSVDYVIAAVVSFIMSVLAGFFISILPFFFAFFVAVPIGAAISEIVFRALRKRRGRYTTQVVGAAMVLGVLLIFPFVGNLFSLIIFAFVGIGTATARLQVGLRV
jgi:hypothetical protein